MWAEDELAEDTLDLGVSAALVDANGEAAAGAGRQRLRARAGGVLVAGAGRDAAGLRRRRRRGRATWRRRPATRARRWPAYAAVEALREAVDAADAGCRKDVAAAAWHAESLLRFLSTALGGRVAGVWVNEDGFIAVTAELSAVVEASIAVGPEGSFACTVSTATRISRLAVLRAGSQGALGGGRRAGLGAATVNARRHRRDSCPNHPTSAVSGSRNRVRRASVDGPWLRGGQSSGV